MGVHEKNAALLCHKSTFLHFYFAISVFFFLYYNTGCLLSINIHVSEKKKKKEKFSFFGNLLGNNLGFILFFFLYLLCIFLTKKEHKKTNKNIQP